MKKTLLFSLLAAGSLFLGGQAANAAVLDPAEWIISPANGGTTATVPSQPSTICQTISFRMNDISVDDYSQGKVSVKYAGETIPFASYAHMEPWEDDDLEDYYGWSFAPLGSYDGVRVSVNYQVFSKPGTLEITLQEGTFVTEDGDVSPALTYTHTYGSGDVPVIEKTVKVKEFNPAAESTIKSLNQFTALFDLNYVDDGMQIFCDDSKADQITAIKAGAAEPIKATSVAFDELAFVEGTMPYTISFPEITEPGEYTVTIPAGFFWAALDNLSKPEDAISNEEITVKYTVDPNMKSGIQVYNILDPEQSPATIESFEEVNIEFPEIPSQIQFDDEADITITKDGQPLDGVTCSITWNWSLGNMHTAKIYFEKDEDYYVIKEAGTYELTIPAGTIYYNGQGCDEIKATFIVKSTEKTYTWTATPANGGKIDLPTTTTGYTKFTFAINGADEVSYDEWEDPDHDPIYGTTAKSIQITYNGVSVKNVANVAAGGDENIGYSLRDNWEEPEVVIGISNQVFNKGGILKITIDKGRFTADGNHPTPAIDYTLNIGEIQATGDYEVVVSPKMNIDEEYLIDYFNDGFKIEFTNAETVVPNMVKDLDDDNNTIMVMEKVPHLKVGGVYYFGEVNVEEVKDAENPTFIITYPEMFDIDTTLGGLLEFSVDEGTFTVDGQYDSPAISQTWRLKRTKEVDTSYIFGPEGDIVNQGFGLYAMISFNSDEYITLNRSGVVVKFDDEVISDYELEIQNGDNKCLYFKFEGEKYTDPTLTGKISVEIPAGAVTVTGIAIDAISHTWNIVLPKTYTYVVKGFASKYLAGPTYDYKNPALTTELPDIADLSEIIIEIPDAKTAKVWNNNYINLRSRDYFTYGAKAPVEIEEVENADCPTFKLKFAVAPTVETIYELSLNYGALYVDNAIDSPSMEFAVNLNKNSGIDIVASDANGTYTVVSIDGRVLIANGTIDQLKSLSKGIYIINGKKVAVK